MSNPLTSRPKQTSILSKLLLASLTLFSLTSFASKEYHVAIDQIVAHPSLNKAKQGVEDAIKAADLPVKFSYENANGSLTTSVQIAQKLAGQKPDVIVAISTPSAQTVASSTARSKIPLVFVSVTSPIQAKLVSNLEHPGGHITGSMDAPPYAEQVHLIHKLLPKAKKVGIIYNPGEVNSVEMIKNFKQAASNLNVIEAPAANSNEVASALRSLVGKVDLIYLPMDNTVVSAFDVLLKLTMEHNIPIIASDPDSVKRGALAAIGYSHYDVGYIAGEKVVSILKGEKPGNIPVTEPSKKDISINVKTAESLGIKISPELLSTVTHVVD